MKRIRHFNVRRGYLWDSVRLFSQGHSSLRCKDRPCVRSSADNAYTHTAIYTLHTHTHIHTHTRIHAYTYTRIHAYTRIHTHCYAAQVWDCRGLEHDASFRSRLSYSTQGTCHAIATKPPSMLPWTVCAQISIVPCCAVLCCWRVASIQALFSNLQTQ